MVQPMNYRHDLDVLKGIAILAVVLYHIGVCPSGYLGVDVFFVINGFFIVPKVVDSFANGSFNYFQFIEKRLFRLLPLLLIVNIACVVAGFFIMLPDDYENLNESVVASSFFANNILSAITTKNYWDVGNDYKPLMHTWYIGILMQFYLILPLLVYITKKLAEWLSAEFRRRHVLIALAVVSFVSLLLYIMPNGTLGDKFYYLQYRFYELGIGGMAGLCFHKMNGEGKKLHVCLWVEEIGFLLLIVFLFFGIVHIDNGVIEYNIVNGMKIQKGGQLIPSSILLLLIVALTVLFVIIRHDKKNFMIPFLEDTKLLGALGRMSYSLFLIHQPILAFYRYCVSDVMSLFFVLVFLFVIVVLGQLSYTLVEKKLKLNTVSRWIVLLTFLIINGVSYKLYLQAGVVRDVPELGVKKANVHRNMFADYCDRVYQWDKPFPVDNGKKNVLVIGHSFSRDWANVLLESEMSDSINLSYHYKPENVDSDRIANSDLIFNCAYKHDVPDFYWKNKKVNGRIIGIGTKSFGSCNGIVYAKRNQDSYYNQTTTINPNFFTINSLMKEEWGDDYVDFFDAIRQKDGSIRVFSDDHMFLSQDCRHLTEAGAKFYAQNMNIRDYIK